MLLTCLSSVLISVSSASLLPKPSSSNLSSTPVGGVAKNPQNCKDRILEKFPFLGDFLNGTGNDAFIPCSGIAKNLESRLNDIIDNVVNTCKEEASRVANKVVENTNDYASALLKDKPSTVEPSTDKKKEINKDAKEEKPAKKKPKKENEEKEEDDAEDDDDGEVEEEEENEEDEEGKGRSEKEKSSKKKKRQRKEDEDNDED